MTARTDTNGGFHKELCLLWTLCVHYLQQGETVLNFPHVWSHWKCHIWIRVIQKGLDQLFQSKNADRDIKMWRLFRTYGNWNQCHIPCLSLSHFAEAQSISTQAVSIYIWGVLQIFNNVGLVKANYLPKLVFHFHWTGLLINYVSVSPNIGSSCFGTGCWKWPESNRPHWYNVGLTMCVFFIFSPEARHIYKTEGLK